MKPDAPEKIWVHELSAKELGVPLTEYHIEYTRTDAFVEKACEWLRNSGIIHDNSGGYDREFIINKFRKAMEE